MVGHLNLIKKKRKKKEKESKTLAIGSLPIGFFYPELCDQSRFKV